MTNFDRQPISPEDQVKAKVAGLSPDELTTVTRGLSRTKTVGRTESGLPITEEGLMVAELMRQNAKTVITKKMGEQ